MEGLQFRKTCLKSTRKSIKTQLIEHRIEWKAIIITLIEMSGRKRKQLTLGSWKSFKKLVEHRGEKVEIDIPTVATVKYVKCDICKQEFVIYVILIKKTV